MKSTKLDAFVTLVTILGCLAVCWEGGWRAAAAQARRASAAIGAEAALDTFKLAAGFRIELVAAEPDVVDPVALTFDAMGRLYVVEMRDYPGGSNAPPGRIRLLEDRDEDGRMDRSTIFADGLTFPTGVLAWNNGVLVTAAPDLLYFKDTNGDGKADVRTVLWTGFATGNPQHRVNGLAYGLDNWIYGANGSGRVFRGDVVGEGKPPVVAGSDFRFHPGTGRFEWIAGRAQFGLAMDDWNNRFINCDSHHIRHAGPRLRRLGWGDDSEGGLSLVEDISDHGELARVYPVSKVEDRFNEFSHAGHTTSSCGLLIYRGGDFPGAYDGAAFMCEPAHHLIHCDRLEGDGVHFVAKRVEVASEFLASTDPWFRPVHLALGPDGCFYIADFHRAVIEHPYGIPKEMQFEVDFRAGADQGRIFRVVYGGAAKPLAGRLHEADHSQLVSELENRNAWRRLTAQRLLIERQDKSLVSEIRTLLRRSRLV